MSDPRFVARVLNAASTGRLYAVVCDQADDLFRVSGTQAREVAAELIAAADEYDRQIALGADPYPYTRDDEGEPK